MRKLALMIFFPTVLASDTPSTGGRINRVVQKAGDSDYEVKNLGTGGQHTLHIKFIDGACGMSGAACAGRGC